MATVSERQAPPSHANTQLRPAIHYQACLTGKPKQACLWLLCMPDTLKCTHTVQACLSGLSVKTLKKTNVVNKENLRGKLHNIFLLGRADSWCLFMHAWWPPYTYHAYTRLSGEHNRIIIRCQAAWQASFSYHILWGMHDSHAR